VTEFRVIKDLTVTDNLTVTSRGQGRQPETGVLLLHALALPGTGNLKSRFRVKSRFKSRLETASDSDMTRMHGATAAPSLFKPESVQTVT
jgi:hypothetical protein